MATVYMASVTLIIYDVIHDVRVPKWLKYVTVMRSLNNSFEAHQIVNIMHQKCI